MTSHKDPNFSYNTPDVHGIIPSRSLIGQMMQHNGNMKIYIIFAFAWMGETDEWGYAHREAGNLGPLIVRPMSHLTGVMQNGEPRYKVLA